MHSLVILAVVLAVGSAKYVSYDGYKVYQLLPSSEEQILFVKTLAASELYDFWSPIKGDAGHIDVMVKPDEQARFVHLLKNSGIEYQIAIPDVGSVIQQQHLAKLQSPKLAKGEITFTQYHTYDEIQAYLHKLAKTHPHAITESIGKSYQGRDINVIKISSDFSANKPIIFIDGELHAREWIAPATVLYIIHQLLETPDGADLLKNVDWYIVPTLNPDGYAYTFTDDRLWRKTLSPNDGSIFCPGTDGNRNFGFHWGGMGSSSDICTDIYKGKKAFSESETKALQDYIWKIKENVKLYVSFHSYGKYVLYPWGYTYDYPKNADELQALGEAVAESIKAVSGTTYRVGSSSNVLYPSAGTSMDWIKGEAGVELSYTIELPGKGSGFQGFLLPPEDILPVVEETWQGVLKFYEYVDYKYGRTD